MNALAVADLGVALGGVEILAGVDVAVDRGEWVGILGPNGAGKTTLLRAISGTVPVSRGTVALFGMPTSRIDRARRARLVASVPQRPVIPPDMRVIDYVLLGRTPHIPYLASESPEDVEAAGDALRSLELADLAARRLGELSGGETQRAVLARALAQGAPLLLLDEPTTALDVGHQQQVMEMVDRMRLDSGLTVVAAVHDLTLAAQFCDRVVLLAGGRPAAAGPPHSVLTEDAIREHFGASVRVVPDGVGGVAVVPVREPADAVHDRMAVET